MGFFDGLLGNATRTDAASVQRELSPMLIDNEQVHIAYKLVRDLIVFTNKRLINVNKQGLTGSKVEYLSIPYRQIQRFAVENAGTFDMEAELKIWVSGRAEPLQWTFGRNESIVPIQKGLATYVLA